MLIPFGLFWFVYDASLKQKGRETGTTLLFVAVLYMHINRLHTHKGDRMSMDAHKRTLSWKLITFLHIGSHPALSGSYAPYSTYCTHSGSSEVSITKCSSLAKANCSIFLSSSVSNKWFVTLAPPHDEVRLSITSHELTGTAHLLVIIQWKTFHSHLRYRRVSKLSVWMCVCVRVCMHTVWLVLHVS